MPGVWAGVFVASTTMCLREVGGILDHGEHFTWLHARLPGVFCLEHGVRRILVPWALPDARFTTAFERHAINVLLEADVLGERRVCCGSVGMRPGT